MTFPCVEYKFILSPARFGFHFAAAASDMPYANQPCCLASYYISLAGAATCIIFVATKVLSQKTPVCHDKRVFVMTKHIFCQDKNMLVTTNMFVVINMCLLWQHVCRNKHNSVTMNIILSQQAYFCHEKRRFVVTNTCVSRQNFCCNKNDTCGSSHQ